MTFNWYGLVDDLPVAVALAIQVNLGVIETLSAHINRLESVRRQPGGQERTTHSSLAYRISAGIWPPEFYSKRSSWNDSLLPATSPRIPAALRVRAPQGQEKNRKRRPRMATSIWLSCSFKQLTLPCATAPRQTVSMKGSRRRQTTW